MIILLHLSLAGLPLAYRGSFCLPTPTPPPPKLEQSFDLTALHGVCWALLAGCAGAPALGVRLALPGSRHSPPTAYHHQLPRAAPIPCRWEWGAGPGSRPTARVGVLGRGSATEPTGFRPITTEQGCRREEKAVSAAPREQNGELAPQTRPPSDCHQAFHGRVEGWGERSQAGLTAGVFCRRRRFSWPGCSRPRRAVPSSLWPGARGSAERL